MSDLSTIEQNAGRLIVAGFHGTTAPTDVLEAVRAGEVGGIILFTRNFESVEQLADLCGSLHEAAPWPLLVAVDQEGGRVQRFREPFTPLPPMRVLGERGDENLAFEVGRLLARELSAVGINWNLAPVLDVDTNPDNPVIGDRSLGRNAELVGRLGVALAKGLEEGGLLSCAKHFPGHGDTVEDSHHALPLLRHDRDRLDHIELRPFAAYVNAGLAAVMTAHVLFPAVDETYPATLSPRVIEILRRDLGFEGLVVSDDLEMKAVADRYPIEEIIERGVEAGLDVFLVCSRFDDARRASERLRELATGPLGGSIASSLRRIANSFQRTRQCRDPLLESAKRAALIGCEAHRALVSGLL